MAKSWFVKTFVSSSDYWKDSLAAVKSDSDIADAIAKKHSNASDHAAHSDDQDLSGLQPKESGKGLSDNNYTTTEKNKLSGVEASAVALATVKADTDLASAISLKHSNGNDHAAHSDDQDLSGKENVANCGISATPVSTSNKLVDDASIFKAHKILPLINLEIAQLGHLSDVSGYYVSLYSGGTVTITQTFTLNSTTVATSGSTFKLCVGMAVAGTGISANTVIASIDSETQLTLNQVATQSGAKSLTFTDVGGNSMSAILICKFYQPDYTPKVIAGIRLPVTGNGGRNVCVGIYNSTGDLLKQSGWVDKVSMIAGTDYDIALTSSLSLPMGWYYFALALKTSTIPKFRTVQLTASVVQALQGALNFGIPENMFAGTATNAPSTTTGLPSTLGNVVGGSSGDVFLPACYALL